MKQVIRGPQFARGMPGHRQQQFLRRNAAAVIRNFDQTPPRLFNVNAHLARAGIDCIFQQFFHHGGRPFYHLAGSNL